MNGDKIAVESFHSLQGQIIFSSNIPVEEYVGRYYENNIKSCLDRIEEVWWMNTMIFVHVQY